MFCTKCGTILDEGNDFCTKCGNSVQPTYPPEHNAQPAYPPYSNTQPTYPLQSNAQPAYPPQTNTQPTYPPLNYVQPTPAEPGSAEFVPESKPRRKNNPITIILLGIIAVCLIALVVRLFFWPQPAQTTSDSIGGQNSEPKLTAVKPGQEPDPASSPESSDIPPSTDSPDSSEKPAPEEARLLLPQMDCSTARIPITEAIYEYFTGEQGYEGPAPISSRTHGAWMNLADGEADIIFLVAPTEDELDYFAGKGMDIEMKVYGYDGLVFIGNESNPIRTLTSAQIRDIYSGKISNWNQVGGTNADIMVYIRNQDSGSQRLFESLVWDGYTMPDFSRMGFSQDEINPTVTQRVDTYYEYGGMDEIVRDVLINQYSIGFNIMSYIDNTFGDSTLKLFAVDGYLPTTENFASGRYPYITTSYVAIRADEPADSPARQLYDWIGSPESERIISENSTLTVSFSDSVFIRAGMGFKPPAVSNPSGGEAPVVTNPPIVDTPIELDYLTEMILKLNRQYISRYDLLYFNLDDLSYLRNGIYALSGYIFQTDIYSQYFNSQSWYNGTISSDSEITALFNDYQKENLKVIIERANELS